MSADPSPGAVRAAADRAFAAFSEGLASGRWQPWFDLLTDDVTVSFPQGRFAGEHHGKARAQEFFAFVRTAYREGLRVVGVDRVTQDGATVVFEFRDEGPLTRPGEPPRPYRNRVAISLDMRGERVCAYREYFGGDGTWF